VDVYALILNKGFLGSLKYANQIDSTNPKLASHIDNVITKLYKEAQAPTAFSGAVRPQNMANNYVKYKYLQQFLQQHNLLNQYKLNQLLKNINDPISQQKISQLIAESYSGAERDAALKTLNDFLAANPNPTAYQNIIHDAANTMGEARILKPSSGAIKNTYQRLTHLKQYGFNPQTSYAHPSLKNVPQGSGLDDVNLQKQLINKSPDEIKEVLAQKDFSALLANGDADAKNIANGAQKVDLVKFIDGKIANGTLLKNDSLLGQYADHLGAAGLIAAEDAVKAGASSKAGALSNFFIKLAAEHPLWANILGVCKDALGPIAVALDAKGLMDDVINDGWQDPATIVQVLTVIAGLASFIPVLTPIAGPLWMILSTAGAFMPHNKKQQDLSENTNEKIIQKAQSITFNDLSPNDQNYVKQFFTTNKDLPYEQVQANLKSDYAARKMNDALACQAVLYRAWEGDGIIPPDNNTANTITTNNYSNGLSGSLPSPSFN